MNAIKSLISEVAESFVRSATNVESAHGQQAIEKELISSVMECCFVVVVLF